MESGLLLNVVIGESAAILQLLSSKDKTLLIRGDTFLVLDLGLDIVDGVAGLHIKSDGLASESFHKNLGKGERGDTVRKLVSLKERHQKLESATGWRVGDRMAVVCCGQLRSGWRDCC